MKKCLSELMEGFTLIMNFEVIGAIFGFFLLIFAIFIVLGIICLPFI